MFGGSINAAYREVCDEFIVLKRPDSSATPQPDEMVAVTSTVSRASETGCSIPAALAKGYALSPSSSQATFFKAIKLLMERAENHPEAHRKLNARTFDLNQLSVAISLMDPTFVSSRYGKRFGQLVVEALRGSGYRLDGNIILRPSTPSAPSPTWVELSPRILAVVPFCPDGHPKKRADTVLALLRTISEREDCRRLIFQRKLMLSDLGPMVRARIPDLPKGGLKVFVMPLLDAAGFELVQNEGDPEPWLRFKAISQVTAKVPQSASKLGDFCSCALCKP